MNFSVPHTHQNLLSPLKEWDSHWDSRYNKQNPHLCKQTTKNHQTFEKKQKVVSNPQREKITSKETLLFQKKNNNNVYSKYIQRFGSITKKNRRSR